MICAVVNNHSNAESKSAVVEINVSYKKQVGFFSALASLSYYILNSLRVYINQHIIIFCFRPLGDV